MRCHHLLSHSPLSTVFNKHETKEGKQHTKKIKLKRQNLHTRVRSSEQTKFFGKRRMLMPFKYHVTPNSAFRFAYAHMRCSALVFVCCVCFFRSVRLRLYTFCRCRFYCSQNVHLRLNIQYNIHREENLMSASLSSSSLFRKISQACAKQSFCLFFQQREEPAKFILSTANNETNGKAKGGYFSESLFDFQKIVKNRTYSLGCFPPPCDLSPTFGKYFTLIVNKKNKLQNSKRNDPMQIWENLLIVASTRTQRHTHIPKRKWKVANLILSFHGSSHKFGCRSDLKVFFCVPLVARMHSMRL